MGSFAEVVRNLGPLPVAFRSKPGSRTRGGGADEGRPSHIVSRPTSMRAGG